MQVAARRPAISSKLFTNDFQKAATEPDVRLEMIPFCPFIPRFHDEKVVFARLLARDVARLVNLQSEKLGGCVVKHHSTMSAAWGVIPTRDQAGITFNVRR